MVRSLISFATILATVSAHSVITNAQGDEGSPSSVGFGVNPNVPRNCTGINPCQQDAAIIRDAEISANAVNECGRTELTGNIDIGENTEKALAANRVTKVHSRSKVEVTFHQVNSDGAGPYDCVVIEAGNNGVISKNLTVEKNIPGVNGFSLSKAEDFNLTIIMPDQFNCTGSSSGNVCTIRCRNNSIAGPFGGCFPVEQTDTTPQANTPANIKSGITPAAIDAQVANDKIDFAAAMKSNAAQGMPAFKQIEAKAKLIASSVNDVDRAYPVATPWNMEGGNKRPDVPRASGVSNGAGGNNGGSSGTPSNGGSADAGSGNGSNTGSGSGLGAASGAVSNNKNNQGTNMGAGGVGSNNTSSGTNMGTGGSGSSNMGSSNMGSGNTGSGNTGSSNMGTGGMGSSNMGSGSNMATPAAMGSGTSGTKAPNKKRRIVLD